MKITQLIAHSRLRVQQDRVYLDRLKHELANTHGVIERATVAYTVSDWLLRKINGPALEAADHKTMPVNEPQPYSIQCSRCQSPMVWFHAVLADDRRALQNYYQCEKCGFVSQVG